MYLLSCRVGLGSYFLETHRWSVGGFTIASCESKVVVVGMISMAGIEGALQGG